MMSVDLQRCPLCGSGDAQPLLQVLSRRIVRCQGCGLLYRNPRPTVVSSAPPLRLEERVGERRSHLFRRFLARAGPPGKLLDVGCGYGFFLKLAQDRGWEVVGVDLDPQAVSYASDRLEVKALCGDLRGFRFEKGSFDLVTLWNVIECVPDPVALLLEVHRVLKPDGRLFIRTQNAVWHEMSFQMTRWLKAAGVRRLFDERPYLTFIFNLNTFSPSTLRLLFERTGFVPLRIRNSPPIPGDPYLGLGAGGEVLVTLAKRVVHGMAQSVFALSGGHWLIGPSLEAWGQRMG
jgi:SAM-dependent methyltransferase